MHISKLGLNRPESEVDDPFAASSQKIPTPKVVDAVKASDADFKLLSPQYRERVRLVLEWLGEPVTYGSYRRLSEVVDFPAMAESIENPTLPAICHMTDLSGKLVKVNGEPVTFFEEIPVKHKDNPQKWCSWKGRSKVFVKWWLS